MRKSIKIVSSTQHFAMAAFAGILYAGASALGAGGNGAAPSPGGGHAAAPAAPAASTGGGGAAAAPSNGASTPTNGTAAGKGSGGGQAVGAGGNTSPAVSPAKSGQSPAGSNTTPRQNVPANTGSHTALDRRNSNNYGYYGYIGNPWSPNYYGWYGPSYPEEAYFEQPVYTDNNSNNNSNSQNNSNTAPQLNPQPTPPQSNAVSPAAAQAQLTNAVDKSPAMMSANAAVQSAQVAYDNERVRVMAALTHKPEYQQALDRKNMAADQVNTVKETSAPTTAPSVAVTNAATVKLDASGEVTKMEEEAIAADPQAADAKSRLNAAVAERDQLRARMMAPR